MAHGRSNTRRTRTAVWTRTPKSRGIEPPHPPPRPCGQGRSQEPNLSGGHLEAHSPTQGSDPSPCHLRPRPTVLGNPGSGGFDKGHSGNQEPVSGFSAANLTRLFSRGRGVSAAGKQGRGQAKTGHKASEAKEALSRPKEGEGPGKQAGVTPRARKGAGEGVRGPRRGQAPI